MPNVIPHFKIFPARSPQRIMISGGILLFSVTLAIPSQFSGAAALANSTLPNASPSQTQSPFLLSHSNNAPTSMLPQAIADTVLQAVAQRTNQPISGFKIQSSESNQWTDSCLGLANAGEICAQVITPGWRVEVSDGQTTWIYRTDRRGKTIRLESAN
ncbi:MAG: hypothetical protein VKJ27_05585 [Synechocystis sp.]|nr:hypothetical protein [Synechocystis sp.]